MVKLLAVLMGWFVAACLISNILVCSSASCAVCDSAAKVYIDVTSPDGLSWPFPFA